jgi:hypothetical protein
MAKSVSQTVDAVLIKRYISQACDECDVSLYGVDPKIELGTVIPIDPSTRRTVTIATPHQVKRFDLEVVGLIGDPKAQWVPVELINWPGK